MKRPGPVNMIYYDEEIVKMMIEKYGLSPMEALQSFWESETYRMLCDAELFMWEFSPFEIFDMWESERITGDPRNSIYLGREIS